MTSERSYRHFVFVMEQGLGHVTHSLNLDTVLSSEPGFAATVLPVRPGETAGVRPVPLTRNWSIQTSWATRRLLQATARRRHIDAIFIHTQVASLFTTELMRRVPTIVSVDATPIDFDRMGQAYGHHRQAAPLERAKFVLNQRALQKAAAVVTWSDWAAESVVEDYGVPAERVHAIYPGVQLSRFDPPPSGREPGPLRLLFVGGDFERKGGPDLLHAAARCDIPLELDIVTSRPSVRVPDDMTVRFHTGVSPDSPVLYDLYRRADLFVLPTRGDCTPLVVAEAMASRLPVIATTVGSIPDMVANGRCGLLVPPADPESLADALRTLTQSAEMRARMAAEARRAAEAEHDADHNWRRIFALMGQVSAARPGMQKAEAI